MPRFGKIALIAGSDKLPLIFAKEASGKGEQVTAIAIKGYSMPEIENIIQTHWIEPGQLAKLIGILKEGNFKYAVMQGKIPQSIIFAREKLDNQSRELLNAVKNGQTQSLLQGIAMKFEKFGVHLLDARTYMDDVLEHRKGTMTSRDPDAAQWGDIEFGSDVLKVTGKLDLGQCVVVKNKAILAIEAIEGTDAAIRRGAMLGNGNVVVIKLAKPAQDMRFDLPVIGMGTVEVMVETKASVLAIEKGKTIIVDRDNVVQQANRENLAIVAI